MGVLAYGEECEATRPVDPICTQACRLVDYCSDSDCVYIPFCGDGIKNGPEECDDGADTGIDGMCTSTCNFAPLGPP